MYRNSEKSAYGKPGSRAIFARRIVAVMLIAGAIAPLATAARAEQSAGALVEEIDSGVAGITQFDTLRAGQSVDLRPNHHAVISYLDNCSRETITGGLVKIGKSQSEVQGGQVSRETVQCNAGQLALNNTDKDQSATIVFRPLPTVPSLSPLIIAEKATKVTLTRTDKDVAPIVVPLKKGRVDLEAAGIALQPGGVYQVTAGNRKTTIMIDPAAKPGDTPVLRRLVKL